jgi:hypothetical protein
MICSVCKLPKELLIFDNTFCLECASVTMKLMQEIMTTIAEIKKGETKK